ncbi:alpha/beta-hydrolase [Meira miltonrushii]|uniref:Alpha/beta-hydrolase n=1 Tax=Meira miltonrushii TaxID=1280837 RepID=A0A316V305_9BASI|nr:alpha/beta-hydrolase [Meira miltonrushii]PWN31842.1 alpha/beta-hydrolase [Meira miltonrushii]
MIGSTDDSCITLGLAVNAQFVAEPQDLIHKQGAAGINVRYKEVPSGICESTPGVKSFSGYSDVGKDEHLFWYFFETRNGDPKKAPLTVIINGGPGSSSMISVFQENGPCHYRNSTGLTYNPYSWNNVSNVLYIDQPVGTGFSYSTAVPGYVNPNYSDGLSVNLPSENCPDYAQPYGTCGTYSNQNVVKTANSTQNAAPAFWKALQGFMGAFDDYACDEFHFATESYGGHYGPVFNEYFLEQNKKSIEGAKKINIKSVTINNGWYDPLIQYQAYYNYTVNPGNPYDLDLYNQTIKDEIYNSLYGPGNCVDQIRQCYSTGRDDVCSQADDFCSDHVEMPYDVISGRDEYDMRELTPDPFPYEDYVNYLNTPNVLKAIGAFTNYTESSNYVGGTFTVTGDDARESMTIKDLRKLLKAGITVTLWAGDAGYICNYIGGLKVAELVHHEGFDEAGFTDLKTPDHKIHGSVRQSGLFSFTRIYQAGHQTAFYSKISALAVFNRSIHGLDIATGDQIATKDYRTQGPKESPYREGNSTVQYYILPANSTYDYNTNAPTEQSQQEAKQENSDTLLFS